VQFAPRLDPRLLRAVAELDDRRSSIAEVRRRVGAVAVALDLPRPSYETVRQLVHEQRLRRGPRRSGWEPLLELAYNTRRADAIITELLVGD